MPLSTFSGDARLKPLFAVTERLLLSKPLHLAGKYHYYFCQNFLPSCARPLPNVQKKVSIYYNFVVI